MMKSVVVSPVAAASMILHAAKHAHQPVHGVLLGSFEEGGAKVHVAEAVPVCHGAPTQPLLEAALSLIESTDDKAIVVGWYVSPRLQNDERPGPAALKIVSGLADTRAAEPTLLVVGANKNLPGQQCSIESSLRALGKDFGKRWLEPLKLHIDGGSAAVVQEAFGEGKGVTDLLDHFEGDPKTTNWYRTS